MAIKRIPIRRAMIAVAVLSCAFGVVRWFWLREGGSLPIDRLRPGMTKAEVRAAIGPPQSESPDGSRWDVTRPESLYRLQIDFDSNNRLQSLRMKQE